MSNEVTKKKRTYYVDFGLDAEFRKLLSEQNLTPSPGVEEAMSFYLRAHGKTVPPLKPVIVGRPKPCTNKEAA
jgi:hypothetical protein